MPQTLPDAPGAYGLVIHVAAPLGPAIRSLPPFELPRGLYLYAGSAHGPGGIRSRVRRHLKADKAVRWHIDRLTNARPPVLVIALPGGNECGLIDAALAWEGTGVPAPGFGSSDCRTCQAHLVSLPENIPLGDFDDDWRLKEVIEATGAMNAVTWRGEVPGNQMIISGI